MGKSNVTPVMRFKTPTVSEYISARQKIESPMANLIVKAAIKEQLDQMNVSSDFYDALDAEVSELLEETARRANENDRKSVQPRDL